MKPSTHIATALFFSAVSIKLGMVTQPIELLAGAIITAKLPDIDLKLPLLRHRGQTHSIICPILLYIASWYYSRSILLGMAIGWLSHLLIDLFNGKGIEILWPISTKNYRIADIKYNGIAENILLGVMIISIIGMVVTSFVKVDISVVAGMIK